MRNLSKQEKAVLQHLKEGKKNRDIAAALGIHEKTISTYVSRMKVKLGLTQDHNTYILVTTAIEKEQIAA